MTSKQPQTNHEAIRTAIGHLYRITLLTEADYLRIACIFLESGYPLNEIKRIDRTEVFPLLKWQLLGFPAPKGRQDFNMHRSDRARTARPSDTVFYFLLGWLLRWDWSKIGRLLKPLPEQHLSFPGVCLQAHRQEEFPFMNGMAGTKTFLRLKLIALHYRMAGQQEAFAGYLQEGQYYVNLWAACLLLELFPLSGREPLIEGPAGTRLASNCYDVVLLYKDNFVHEEQRVNCLAWLRQHNFFDSLLQNT